MKGKIWGLVAALAAVLTLTGCAVDDNSTGVPDSVVNKIVEDSDAANLHTESGYVDSVSDDGTAATLRVVAGNGRYTEIHARLAADGTWLFGCVSTGGDGMFIALDGDGEDSRTLRLYWLAYGQCPSGPWNMADLKELVSSDPPT